MTFDGEQYCKRLQSFETEGEEEQSIGEEGALTIALLSSGRCSVWPGEGEEALMASAGDLVVAKGPVRLLPVGQSHVLAISLSGLAAEAFSEGFARPAVLSGPTVPGAAELVARLFEGTGSPASLSAAGYELLCILSEGGHSEEAMPPLVAAAIAHIREHYAAVYGVEELAKSLHVSKSHLVRSFSAATGVTPGRFLTSVRIEAAKNLLLRDSDEYSLEVIASLSGFSGANYLCKVFRKSTGESPTAYRSRMRSKAGTQTKRTDLEELLYL